MVLQEYFERIPSSTFRNGVAVGSTKKCTINNVASGGDNAVINTSASVPCNLAGYVSRGEVPELL